MSGSVSVLVVGAQPGSLGAAVATVAGWAGMRVHTAGVSGTEVHRLDLLGSSDHLSNLMLNMRPDHIVCTAGVNYPPSDKGAVELDRWMARHMDINYVGPMRLLDAYVDVGPWKDSVPYGHYVAISSNSARIPRSGSMAYCASKAALSMALRVAAREARGGEYGHIAYGYEPGLLAGTPMTKETGKHFSGLPLHRMRGPALEAGVPTQELARLIVHNLLQGGPALNGLLIPYDADEL